MNEERKCIDYEKAAHDRYWWLNKTGGAAKDNLTVRDYFATKALQVVLGELATDLYINKETLRSVASDAYRMADAMLEEREPKQPTQCTNDFINEQKAKAGEAW